MGSRRAYLAGVAGLACGALAGCTADDDAPTTAPGPTGSVFAVALDGATPGQQVGYPRGDDGSEYVLRALERAAASGDRGEAEIPNETAFEGATDSLRGYPSAPQSADANGLVVEFEGEYYAVQLIRLE